MRSISWRVSAVAFVSFLVGAVVATAATPIWKSGLMWTGQAGFSDLTYKCDLAMRDHMIAKQGVGQAPSEATVRELNAAEIGLIACQDYDLMRKKLARWGLSDNELSEMALVAIEERAATLQEVVRIHEIRY